MKRSMCVSMTLAVALSCTWKSPDLPPTDTPLEGVYEFTWADNSLVKNQLEGAQIEFTPGGEVTLTNPGFTTEEYGIVDVVEAGGYSFVEQAPDSGILMLDITRQAPPKLSGAYVFHGGLNRLICTRASATGEEILKIRLVPDGSTRSWAHFVRKIVPAIAGNYTFVRATTQALDDLLSGSHLSFGADSSFILQNPVLVTIAHQDSLVLVVERGTYAVSLDSLEFREITQEPAGADSLFLLAATSTRAGIGFERELLAVAFSQADRAGTTFWRPPQTVAEAEPNDTIATATPLGGTGAYTATGTLSSGGVDQQGNYAGDRDYFSVSPSRDGEVRAELTWQGMADLDLFLVGADNSVVARSTNVSQAPPEALTASVVGGQTYYLLVVSFDYPATYSCTVVVP